MIKISKLADYAVLIMVHLTKCSKGEACNARDIARSTHLALPTVSKILKLMARQGLLISQRGASGGYVLARPASKISVAAILGAIDGDVALTKCDRESGACSLEPICTVQDNWRVISSVIQNVLENLTLTQMTQRSVVPRIEKELKQLW